MSTSKRKRPSRAIPEALHGAISAQFKAVDPSTGKPYTSRAIAAWLKTTHGIDASYRTVLRIHAATAEHGHALIVEALRAELRDAVGPAKAKLTRVLRRLDTLAARSKSVKDVAAAVNATTRALHELAHLGGVAAPLAVDLTSGGQPLDIARTRLAESLTRLAQEPDGTAAGGASGGPPA